MAAGRPRSFDEAHILEQAMMVFWAKGFEATSVSALEKATGLGRQSLYNAFGGKRALYEACLAHYERTRSAAMEACLTAGGSPLAAIERLFSTWRGAAAESCRGCLLLNALAEFGGRDPELLGVVDRVFARQREALADRLRAAQVAGELPSDLDPVKAARRLQATGNGMLLLSKLQPGDDVLDDIVADSLASLRPLPAAGGGASQGEARSHAAP